MSTNNRPQAKKGNAVYYVQFPKKTHFLGSKLNIGFLKCTNSTLKNVKTVFTKCR